MLANGAAALGLVRGPDGNYYGVKAQGGPNRCRPALPISCGTIIKVTPAGEESIFYAFGSIPDDGYTPNALITGKDGALYGLTSNGGKFGGGGTFFKITTAGQYSSLYSFASSPTDGHTPSGITQGSDGNFYGTTASGGANTCALIPQAGTNCGTVFRMTSAGVQTILHSFGSAPSDGIQPLRTLLEGDDGYFYGTTSMGGANQCASNPHDCGTAFKISTSGAVTILHSFGSSAQDGIAPSSVLIKGRGGEFYGATSSGGGGRCGWQYGCGTIYKIASSGSVSILYRFALDGRIDGDGPSSLLLGRDGNLYGTTYSGGASQCDSCGTVFKLTPAGVKTTLYSFGPVNEKSTRPTGLTEGADGALYGMLEWPVNNYNPTVGGFKVVGY